jgi:hypothetical protein
MLRKSLIKIVFSCCVYNGMHLVQYYVSFVTKVNRYVYGSSLFLFHLSDLNYEQLRLCHCCLPLCETIVSRHNLAKEHIGASCIHMQYMGCPLISMHAELVASKKPSWLQGKEETSPQLFSALLNHCMQANRTFRNIKN